MLCDLIDSPIDVHDLHNVLVARKIRKLVPKTIGYRRKRKTRETQTDSWHEMDQEKSYRGFSTAIRTGLLRPFILALSIVLGLQERCFIAIFPKKVNKKQDLETNLWHEMSRNIIVQWF